MIASLQLVLFQDDELFFGDEVRDTNYDHTGTCREKSGFKIKIGPHALR